MKPRIITSFAGWRDADLDQQAQLIGRKMKGNPYFPTLQDKAEAVATAADAFHEALLAARSGSHEDHHKKEDRRQVLETALKDLGFSINLKAGGDRTQLESTGYPVAKTPGARRKPKDPVTVAAGNRSLTVTINDNPGDAPHIVQYTTWPVTESSSWTTVYMTEDELVIADLEPDHKYAVRIAEMVHGTLAPVYGDPIVSKYVE